MWNPMESEELVTWFQFAMTYVERDVLELNFIRIRSAGLHVAFSLYDLQQILHLGGQLHLDQTADDILNIIFKPSV